ncbi:MAG: hypothetical protein ACT4OV_00005, partial [Microthrixaceae bacterium]
RSIEVPVKEAWRTVDQSLATCASSVDDDRLAFDLEFLATPHRLEVELDPSTATFVTRWPLVPLFGAGIPHRLDEMRPPAD